MVFSFSRIFQGNAGARFLLKKCCHCPWESGFAKHRRETFLRSRKQMIFSLSHKPIAVWTNQ
jgi:hypothetical protein